MKTKNVLTATFLFASLAGGAHCQQQSDAGMGPTQAPASAATTLTLRQAEALALKNNPQITIGKLKALIAQQFVREERSALMPTAYVNLTAVDSNPGSRIAAAGPNHPNPLP